MVAEKKEKTERVYLQNETSSLITVCLERFERTHNTAYLGICLNLYLGLRVGELVALCVLRSMAADVEPLVPGRMIAPGRGLLFIPLQ